MATPQAMFAQMQQKLREESRTYETMAEGASRAIARGATMLKIRAPWTSDGRKRTATDDARGNGVVHAQR